MPQPWKFSGPKQSSPHKCAFCEDKGTIRYDVELGHPYFGRVFPCPKCQQKVIDAACGLKTHERRITLDSLVTKGRPGAAAMLQAATKFIEKPIGFLSLYGSNGNGKTIVLQAIVNACLAKGIQAEYITAKLLMDHLREAFDPKLPETDIVRIRRLATVPVLVIDEFSDARDTPYAAEMQRHLVNERYRDARTLGTVFAWNVTFDDLPWPSVVSRMQEFPFVENKDPDLRPRIGAKKKELANAQKNR
jgi:chromosomal replication initiation ATPase DnaA